MSYTHGFTSPLNAAAPPPPPKPPQQLPTPPLPPHPYYQHYGNSPPPRPPSAQIQTTIPSAYQSSPTTPARSTTLPPTASGPWPSTWQAPHPSERGHAQHTPNQTAHPYTQGSQTSYTQQQPQKWEQQGEVYEVDPQYQYHPQQPQSHFETPQAYQPQTSYPQEQYHLPASIQSKTITDLSAVLADPQLLDGLIHSPETQPASLQSSSAQLNAQLLENMKLAQSLSSLHDTLFNARATTSSNLLRLRGLETQWKKKQTELERRLEPWGPRELHQRLGAAITEGDGMCGALEASFIDSSAGSVEGVADEREVAEWVRRVREGRRTVALRRERKKRWDEGRVGGWR